MGALLLLIVDACSQLRYAISPTGDTLFFNDAYLSITGLSRQEAEGRQQIPSNTIHPEDQERVSEIWRNCLETKQPFTCEYRVNKPYFYLDPATGEELVGESWILGNGTPDLDENGNVEHVSAILKIPCFAIADCGKGTWVVG